MLAVTINTVVQGTGFTIGAALGIEFAVFTAQLIDAHVGGADVIVLTFQVRIAGARHPRYGRVDATQREVAGVNGAHLGVVAIRNRMFTAGARLADIIRTRIGIGANHRRVLATCLRITGIVGADVEVVAVNRRVETAVIRQAAVGGARVLIVAAHWNHNAALFSVTELDRAEIVVVAVNRRMQAVTRILVAGISGARVTVVAGLRHKQASGLWIARIHAALVVVIAG
jgi:hypothetical protein